MRRVGNGEDTLIWEWPWLIDKDDPNLQTACVEELRGSRVCNLLTSEGAWDEDLLRDLFVEADIAIIFSPVIICNKSQCWNLLIGGDYGI